MFLNEVIQLILLNNLAFLCSVALLIDVSKFFLFFMIGLEAVYLSIISGFATIGSLEPYAAGGVFALFLVGVAASEAAIGFYLVVLLFLQKQTLFFIKALQFKG